MITLIYEKYDIYEELRKLSCGSLAIADAQRQLRSV
jgi:hypothetical protein